VSRRLAHLRRRADGDVPVSGRRARPWRRARARLRDERGFTLVELLMTTVIGTIVLLAAFGIFDAALHAQTRVDDRSDSVARGRNAMEQVVQQLRSQVCLGPGYPAVAYGDGSHVTFYADLADTTFVPQKRDLTFAGGTLTERDYTGTPQAGPPPYSFSGTPSRTRVIARNLANQKQGAATVPFFTYYSFNAANPVRPANLLAVPLSAADMARVVQVTVAFAALPSRGASALAAEPFTANVFVRTADPTDPDHSPLCI
jgi:prepilin-type N-terminal cleavage/methylation domain-containing protein